MKFIAWLAGVAVVGLVVYITDARAGEKVMVMQYNENVRIVLTTRPCPMQKDTVLVVAQRIDKQFMRGCAAYNAKTGIIHIQWSGDKSDFSDLEARRFLPDEITAVELKESPAQLKDTF